MQASSGGEHMSNEKKIPYDLYYVEWVALHGLRREWVPLKDIKPEEFRCYSVGWLVAESDEAVVLVPHIGPADENPKINGFGDITIPRSSLRCMDQIFTEHPNSRSGEQKSANTTEGN